MFGLIGSALSLIPFGFKNQEQLENFWETGEFKKTATPERNIKFAAILIFLLIILILIFL